MKRLWALVVVAIIVAVAIPTYWIVSHPWSSQSCGSGSGGPAPLVQPLGAPPFAVSFDNATRVGSAYWSNFTVLLSYSATVGQLTLRMTFSNGSNATGIDKFLVWSASRVKIAEANGTTSIWAEAASSPLQGGDTVTVVSTASLAGDDLVATVPGACGVTWSATTPIGV